ncbi:GntR family transcriptional regulator [Catellatospora sp. NPDC049111]|jgi:DNA-binding transcriptional regulator YhcF (GntR family)|uniref:GntR family transcriptional regulator n=1 Tax=unclassified Catellatospora TaxID=2645785 RepID=UPI0033CF3F80
MRLEIDTDSAVPPYEQVRAGIATQIAEGTLAPGAHLPTIRQLAADIGLAVNTVARAYRELEAAGLVVSRVRHGTTVAERRPDLPPAEAMARLDEAARAYRAAARALGVSLDGAIQALRRVEAEQPGPERTRA